ncbi:MAG: hypothetical protein IT249_05845 [Chitinophagaceae bacterium]|nr:hypothetical protein [Chitinophagaceae bacterium]
MYFQSSRLDARTNEKGEAVLLDDQNKNLWDKIQIEKGNFYLIAACNGNEISKYHLEAAIAYWHTTPTDQNKWQHILELYNQLILVEYSPIAALNRMFAFARVYGHKKAIAEADKLQLPENSHYYGLLGYLYAPTNIEKAISYYEQAIKLTNSRVEKQTLRMQIEKLNI